MDILKIVFFIFLGFFTLGEVFRFDLGNNSYIKPLDIVTIVIFLIWLYGVLKSSDKNVFKDRLFIPIILFTISMIVSLILNFQKFSSSEIIVASSYIARWVLYASLYLVVKEFPTKFKQKITYTLLFVGGLMVIFGVTQYFLYPNLRNLFYLGWDEHMARLFSTFLDPNFAGAFFVLYLIFSLSISYYLNKGNSKWAKVLWLFPLASLASIFLTYSRSGLIMLFVSIATFLLLIKRLRWILIFTLVISIFILIASRNFATENINLFRTSSTNARVDSVRVATEIIKNNFIFGIGFNTYRYAQVKYGFRNPVNAAVSHADAGTDNSFLFIFATTGIVGLLLYLFLLFNLLQKSYLCFVSSKTTSIWKYLSIATFASIVGIIADSLFINSLFYSFIMIWMWILLGLITSGSSRPKENTSL